MYIPGRERWHMAHVTWHLPPDGLGELGVEGLPEDGEEGLPELPLEHLPPAAAAAAEQGEKGGCVSMYAWDARVYIAHTHARTLSAPHIHACAS